MRERQIYIIYLREFVLLDQFIKSLKTFNNPMVLKTLIEKFFLAYEGVYSEATTQWYRDYLKPLDALGDKKIKEITIDDLRTLYVKLSRQKEIYINHPHENRQKIEKGYSVYTLHSFARSWKRLFNWSTEEGYLNSSPAKKLNLPRLPDPDPKAIQMEDLLTLIEAARFSTKPLRDEAILRFLADSSARAGGAADLLMKDLHIDGGWAIVREKGKGGKGKARSVFFNPATTEAMKKWLAVRPYTEDERVFMLSAGGIYQMIERLAAIGPVEGPHNPHAFRHGFAIGMLSKGANLAQVSQLMGHSSVNVTVAYYGQFPTKELQEFHQKYSWAPKGVENGEIQIKPDILPSQFEEKKEDLDEVVSIPKALEIGKELGYELTASTVYYAARKQNIRDANQYGRDWVFSRGEFLKWLFNRYKPKTNRGINL